MYRITLLCLAVCALATEGTFAATKSRKTSSGKKTVAAKTAAKPVATKAAAKRRTSSARTAGKGTAKSAVRTSRTSTARKSVTAKGKGRKPAPAVARRYYQSAPTPERYKEIQQALAEKGHFKGEADGTWGPDSIDALKRFQKEQNLAPSGKLDSVSLIALGLGPKRNLAASSGSDSITLPSF